MSFTADDAVVITYEGKTVDGLVLMASANGRSLVLGFDEGLGGPLGMFVGFMPVPGVAGAQSFNAQQLTQTAAIPDLLTRRSI